ncbi:hypothetical protein GCM10010466_20450 [Planomonospora alba]|uniref:Serine/threonine protein kinase n=1 Tax=Planomonospora alba TaxID=161354 RepID=A0ABP6MXT9_9ACTN
MNRLGPVLTLAAGAATAAVLGVLSTAPSAAPDAPGGPSEVALATSQAAPAPAEISKATGTPGAARTAETTGTAVPVPARADYAGRVRGDGGLIAVSVRGGRAVGYFCDGRSEAWLKGRVTGGTVALTGPGGASVTARLDGGKATGTLELGSREWRFTAPAVKKPSGLYRATAVVRGATVRAGWIYLPDGSRVGLTLVDGEPVDVAVPEPGENATVRGEQVGPEDVDEFIGEF